MVGQALDSKSSITELCLADNELGVKGAMFVIRKVGLMFRESKGGVVRQTWHSSNSSSRFSLSLTQRPRDQVLAQGVTRKDVDVVFLFNSCPGLGHEPASFNA